MGSASLNALSAHEISKRVRLGLISQDDEESSDEEYWDDFNSSEEESDEEEVYTFSKERRRSSVNLNDMAALHEQFDSGSFHSNRHNMSMVSGAIAEDDAEDDDSSTIEGD